MRKLASIQKVKDIRPIPNADNIEVATIKGWDVVTKKDLHNVGDLIVYCEIDSFLPIREEFEFLRKSSYRKLNNGDEGFRLKTMKMRGQVSQGLIMPLSIIPGEVLFDLIDQERENHDYLIGKDVTEALGITKYERPIPACLAGEMKGDFPSFIQKTDQERIQNLSDEFDDLRTVNWYVSEKLDGTSSTFYLYDGEFNVCSRNLNLIKDEENTYWKVALNLNIEEEMRNLINNTDINNFAIQGEIIGEGIQGNPYKLRGQTLKVFDIFNIDNYTYLNFEQFSNLMNKTNIDIVPTIKESLALPETIEEIVNMSENKSKINEDVEREGLVFKNRNDPNLSFKAISNKFLLQ